MYSLFLVKNLYKASYAHQDLCQVLETPTWVQVHPWPWTVCSLTLKGTNINCMSRKSFHRWIQLFRYMWGRPCWLHIPPQRKGERRAARPPCVSVRTSWFAVSPPWQEKKALKGMWREDIKSLEPLQTGMLVAQSSSHLSLWRTHHFTAQVKPHLTAIYFLGGWSPMSMACVP